MDRDPPHSLVPDDQPLLEELVIVRYRDYQGYGVELMQRREETVRRPSGEIVPLDALEPGDEFIEREGDPPAVVTSVRIGTMKSGE